MLTTQTEHFLGCEKVVFDLLAEFPMSSTFHKTPDLITSDLAAQPIKTFSHGRQGDLRIRLPGLCTDSVQAVVGQHHMGQAAQVEVSEDGILAQHLVIAQPQVAPQFLEENLNVPTPFINRHDLSTVQLCFIGCKTDRSLLSSSAAAWRPPAGCLRFGPSVRRPERCANVPNPESAASARIGFCV